jgi:hypothetical protein
MRRIIVSKTKSAAGLVLGIALTASAITATNLGTAEAAGAVECYDQLSSYKVHNKCAPYVRHWNTFKNRPTSYGAWATKSKWSTQPVCWATFTSRGATVRLS